MNPKEFENVEYINCLVSMITNDARHTHKIKCRIAMAKVGLSKKKKKEEEKKEKEMKDDKKKKKTLFTCKLDLKLKKKQVKCYIWSTVLYGV